MEEGFIDLGLSVYWSAKNFGANTPEDFGDYFTWDEAMDNISKKVPAIEHIPTIEQFEELKQNCKIKFDRTKNGFSITGKNGNSIFIPLAGEINGNAEYVGAYYWLQDTFREKYGYMFYIGKLEKYGRRLKIDKNFILRDDRFKITVRTVREK